MIFHLRLSIFLQALERKNPYVNTTSFAYTWALILNVSFNYLGFKLGFKYFFLQNSSIGKYVLVTFLGCRKKSYFKNYIIADFFLWNMSLLLFTISVFSFWIFKNLSLKRMHIFYFRILLKKTNRKRNKLFKKYN